MSQCSRCEADTVLYENGVPICVGCADMIEAARKKTAREKVQQGEPLPEMSVAAHK
jgi:hypothetical protein